MSTANLQLLDVSASTGVSRPWREFFRRWLIRSLVALLIMGVVARLARDEVFGISIVFYALPLPLLAGITLTLALLEIKSRKRALRWAVCTGLLGMGVVFEDWRLLPDRSETKDLKVVFWNACRLNRGWDEVTAEIRSWDADVIAMVEAGLGERNEMRSRWNEACPGYKVSILGAGIVLLTRGESGTATVHEFHQGSRARQIATTVQGQRLNLVIVDIDANPFRSRDPALGQLIEVVNPLANEPTLVLGDFNTPADSALLEPLRPNYSLAFDLAGQGYRATWPIPLPVLAIDHVWASQQIDVTSCKHLWTKASDHRPVALTIRGSSEPVLTAQDAVR
jgi:vancomycin resistance protein VanJ